MTRRPFDLWEAPEHAAWPGGGRVSDAWAQEIARDTELRHVVMVVEFVLGGGARYRVATELTGDRDGRHAAPVLMAEAPISNGYDLGNAAASARTLAFELPAWFVNPQAHLDIGLPLAGFGEVSLLAPGMAWRDRRVVLRGDMSGGVSFGAVRSGQPDKHGDPFHDDGQSFRFALQDPRESSDVGFPVHVADADAWPDVHPAGIGSPYPYAFGAATTVAVRVSTSTTTPAFVAVYGHGWEVDTVLVEGVDETGNFTISEDHDLRGVPVTVLQAANFRVWADRDEVLAVIRRDPTPTVELVTVIREALQLFAPASPLVVHSELFAAAQAKLNTCPVAGQANDRATLYKWIEEGLLDEFPMVSMVWVGGRYGPVVTDWRAPARTQLTNGSDRLRFRLSDPTESPKGEVFNQFQIRYAYDGSTDQFGGFATRDERNDRLCSLSQTFAGARAYPEIESVHIADDITAAFVLDWLVQHLTLPTLFVSYAAAPSLFFELQLGDVITLTDADLRWFGVVATVETVERQRAFCTLGLRVWQSPHRTGPFPSPPG